jgi:hypothetical protein
VRRALLVLLGSLPGAIAHAYDFQVSTEAVGQGYQVRWFRFSERDRLLNRRRFTETVGLDVWNILEPEFDPGYPERPRIAPIDLYFTASFRLDTDFGEYTDGSITYNLNRVPVSAAATTVVPELTKENLGLQFLYAYVGARRIGGFLDISLGRQLVLDDAAWFSFDGLRVRATFPRLPLALDAWAGLVVRDSSLFSSSTYEPDGTSMAQCRAFSPDVGEYLPVDECRQRDQLMPGFGVALETTGGLHWLFGRIAYRRTVSPSASDVYIDTSGQLPPWGVNQEDVSVSLRLDPFSGLFIPWFAARYSLLLGVVDQAHTGIRVAWRDHAVTPELVYSFPSFDGDSIYNVFSTQPYWDYRFTWDIWPRRGSVRAYVRGFLRQFQNAENPGGETQNTTSGASSAGGVDVGVRVRAGDRGNVRVDGFYEDGYGGLRFGGDAAAHVRLTHKVDVEGRVSVIRFAEDSLSELQGVTFGAQGGMSWRLGEGIVLHFLAEENTNRFDTNAFRVMAILDFAFQPEH